MSEPRVLMTMLVVLMAYAATNTLVWSTAMPVAAGLDEAAYLDVIEFLDEEHRFPEFGVDPGMGVEARTLQPQLPPYAYRSYADRPGLAFVLSAATRSLPDDSPFANSLQARLPGVIYATLLTLFAFLAARQMFPNARHVPVLAAVATASWPQVSVVASTVNDDALTAVACASIIWCWHAGARHAWAWRWSLLLGGLIGLCMLAKPSGYVVAAASLPVAFLTLRGSFGHVLRSLGLTVLGALAVAGWRFAIAFRMYGIDPFNRELSDKLRAATGAVTYPARDAGLSFIGMLRGDMVNTPVGGGSWLPEIADSFFVALPPNHDSIDSSYKLLVLIPVAVAFAELMLRAATTRWRLRERWTSSTFRINVVVFALLPTYLLLLARHNYLVDYVLSGHYLFPALVPIVVGIAVGLAAWASTPGRVRIVGSFVSAALLVANYQALLQLRRIHSVSLRPWLTDARALVLYPWMIALLVTGAALACYWLVRPAIAARDETSSTYRSV